MIRFLFAASLALVVASVVSGGQFAALWFFGLLPISFALLRYRTAGHHRAALVVLGLLTLAGVAVYVHRSRRGAHRVVQPPTESLPPGVDLPNTSPTYGSVTSDGWTR